MEILGDQTTDHQCVCRQLHWFINRQVLDLTTLGKPTYEMALFWWLNLLVDIPQCTVHKSPAPRDASFFYSLSFHPIKPKHSEKALYKKTKLKWNHAVQWKKEKQKNKIKTKKEGRIGGVEVRDQLSKSAICQSSQKLSKGAQDSSKKYKEPFWKECWRFSSFMERSNTLIYQSWEGGWGRFHLRSISHLANKV